MIAKMKFVNITGPKSDIDRMTQKYLLRYPIHLENAMTELKDSHSLEPFVEDNPYKEAAASLKDIAKVVNHGQEPVASGSEFSLAAANELIQTIHAKSAMLNDEKKALEEKEKHCLELQKEIEPFRSITAPVSKILDFQFIKYRFGRIPVSYADNFKKYVDAEPTTIFYESSRDGGYVWGAYFAPQSTVAKTDAILASMHFERIHISDEFTGSPSEAYENLSKQLGDIRHGISRCSTELSNIYSDRKDEINSAYASIKALSEHFDIRKKAACTHSKADVFYILCGWMEDKDALSLKAETEQDDNVDVIIEDRSDNTVSPPPTKLTNRGIFKPFQMFVTMYGLPAYNEIDPTKFLALTYAFMFGVMFGDVGQGACLVIGGYLLYRFKHMNIAGIISFCGLFSVFFGFMYGSCFGFEDWIPTLWLKPMESENMMTVLMLAVFFGVGLIIVAMLIQMANSLKQKNIGAALVGTNGLTGLIFYLIVVYIVVTMLLPALGPTRFMGLLVVLIILSLFSVAFAEPIQAKINKQRFKLHEGPVMFVTEAVFELIEILLSYMTNSISFIRVGAFALSHAGMMSVVMMLSNIENGPSPAGIIIVIFGNILISALEGLIVGIQVLRLEYYEMFGRFYSGTGREFIPYAPKDAQVSKK